MAVTKIIELVGSSATSSDDAVQNALNEARKTSATSRPWTSCRPACAATTSASGAHTCGWRS